MAELPKQSKNKNPDAPIRSDGNVSNRPVSASAPKMPTARKLKKNHAAPIGTPDSAAFSVQFPGQVPQPPPVAHIGCEQVKVGKACGLPTAASKSSSEYFGIKISSSVWPRRSIVSLMAFIPYAIGTIDFDYTALWRKG